MKAETVVNVLLIVFEIGLGIVGISLGTKHLVSSGLHWLGCLELAGGMFCFGFGIYLLLEGLP
jgi:hypothetical protein